MLKVVSQSEAEKTTDYSLFKLWQKKMVISHYDHWGFFIETELVPMIHRYSYWLVYSDEFAELMEDGHSISATVVTSDGRWLFTGWNDTFIICWDLTSDFWKRRWKAHSLAVLCLAFHSGLLVSGSADKTLRIWDAHTFELVRQLDGHSNHVCSVNFNKNGTLIISGSKDSTLRLWLADTGECIRVFEGHYDCVYSALFLTDDLIISGSRDNSLKVWKKEGKKECVRSIKDGITNTVQSLSMNSDGTLVACLCVVEKIIIFSSTEWNIVRTIDESASMACFHPFEASVVAVAMRDHSVRLMNVSNGKLIRIWEGNTDIIRDIHFSPDGTRLILVANQASVRIWDI